MTIAALYARVSTTSQSEDGSSLVTQLDAARAYATARDWLVSAEHEYIETHSGSELFERTELTRLRDAIKHRRVDAVVAYSIDRLSRDPYHLALLVTEAEHTGVAIHFVTEQLDSTPIGRLILQVQGFAAQMEREKIRERSMRGKRARLAEGKLFNYGTDLYGYRRDKERGVRTIHELEAAIVREVFEWIAGGVGIKEVVRRLNARDTPPPGTGKFAYAEERRRFWGTGQVNRMLHNPAYVGEAYALRMTADHHKPGRPTYRPREEWLRLPDTVSPAIVTRAVWDRVQRQLAANRGERTRNIRRPVLLRGLVRCGVCGGRMSHEMTRHYRYYRCNSRLSLAGACGGRTAPAPRVEAWAWGRVVAVLLDPRLIAAADAQNQEPGMTQLLARERDTARRELAKVERKQRRLLEQYENSDNPHFPWDMVEARVSALQRDRERWQETLNRSEAVVAKARTTPAPRDIGTWGRVIAANIPHLTFAEQRTVLEELGVTVTAAGGDETQWRISYDPH